MMLGAVLSLLNATIGAGMVGLPYALRESGVVVGVGLALASALGSLASTILLVRTGEARGIFK